VGCRYLGNRFVPPGNHRRTATISRDSVGMYLAAILVAGNHGLLDANKLVWVAVILVAGIAYAFWEKIENFWK